jgi:hypothetical protein
MANQMWMGIPTRHMQWVPCPTIDSTISRKRYLERIQFQNGGGDARRSPAYQMEYNFNVSGPAHEFEGIDAFNKFASGYYGDGLMYVAHPAIFEANMFSAAWASPGLIEAGWPNIYVNEPAFGSTEYNEYGQPLRTAVFNVDSTPDVPTKTFTIPIPPTHTLHLGVSGTKTGSAVIKVNKIPAEGSAATGPSTLTLISPTSATRMNTTFSGEEYQAVQVYITRTAATVSTISLTSMMAQLYKTSVTPTLPTSHIMGAGSTGMMFADDAIVETYSYMYPPRKGISTTLVEVEAWR